MRVSHLGRKIHLRTVAQRHLDRNAQGIEACYNIAIGRSVEAARFDPEDGPHRAVGAVLETARGRA
jgi:hypothetical protein